MLDTQVLVDEAIEALQSQIDDTAIIACSGGIDSSVAAVVLSCSRGIGSPDGNPRLLSAHVDARARCSERLKP